jgi:hypothetical protein
MNMSFPNVREMGGNRQVRSADAYMGIRLNDRQSTAAASGSSLKHIPVSSNSSSSKHNLRRTRLTSKKSQSTLNQSLRRPVIRAAFSGS